MSDVVLIRPGCTDFDEQNRIQGLPLNDRGREQFVIVDQPASSISTCSTPPCEPARSTAATITPSCNRQKLEDMENQSFIWQEYR
jgi:broad specificity phosphatase PhoE